MVTEVEKRSSQTGPTGGHRGEGWRFGQLLALLGLTGFAVSQPLLAVAGDEPTLFTFAGVSGWGLVTFALIVAVVPPLVLWLVVLLVGLVDRRAGDVAFVVIAALLAGVTAIQWAKTLAGLEQALLLAVVGLSVAAGFAVGLVRVEPVALWTRFTAVLPLMAVVLLLVASPSADLLRSRSSAPDAADRVSGEDEPPPSVVMLMLDEFPLETLLAEDGTIDGVRFPNLAALAQESTWYRDYTVQAAGTLQSVPSLLTSQEPTGKQPLWTAHPDSLFSLLAPTHDLVVSEHVTQLCGFSNCKIEGADDHWRGGVRSVLTQMAEVWRDRVSLGPLPEVDTDQFAAAAEPLAPDDVREGREGGPAARNAEAPGAVVDFVAAIEGSTAPTFAYLHLLLPHQPWMRYPEGGIFDRWSQLSLALDEVEPDEWVRTLLNQAHLYQARYTDRLVGEIIDEIKASDLYDDSLVVVTADHGVAFSGDGNLRSATAETLGSIAYVPLIVKSPGQSQGEIDDSNLMGVDLLPTIASEVGVDIPWKVEGFPAGSAEIADRGGRKQFYDFGTDFGQELLDVIEFDSSEHRPDGSVALIGDKQVGEHSLAPLARSIGVDVRLGETIEDVEAAATSGTVAVGLRDLQNPDQDRSVGRIGGWLEHFEPDDVVLLAIDGEVQSFSPVNQEGVFVFMIPPEVQPRADLEVELLRLRGDELTVLDRGEG